jgi:hypothetical protein
VRIELSGDVAWIVNKEVMLREQRTEMLADDSLARTHSASQHQSHANPLARALSHVSEKGENPVEEFLVPTANVVEQVVAQRLPPVRLGFRLERETAPQIEESRRPNRPIRVRKEFDSFLLAPL